LGFWIGFGWETQPKPPKNSKIQNSNPKNIQKSMKAKI
jgi:hypothetical protein